MKNHRSTSKRINTMKKIAMVLLLAMVPAVSQADTIVATQSGPINDSATWGGTATPGALDGNVWDSSGFELTFVTESFYGGTLRVTGNSNLDAYANGHTLTLAGATIFDAGQTDPDKTPQTFDFNGNSVTIESGGMESRAGNNSKLVNYNNGLWAGSGDINLYRGGATDALTSSFVFNSGNDFSGYTGNIKVGFVQTQRACLLTIEAATSGTFALSLYGPTFPSKLVVSGSTKYHFSDLTLGVDVIAAGTYAYADFTPTQQGYLDASSWTGTITVGDVALKGTVILIQ